MQTQDAKGFRVFPQGKNQTVLKLSFMIPLLNFKRRRHSCSCQEIRRTCPCCEQWGTCARLDSHSLAPSSRDLLCAQAGTLGNVTRGRADMDSSTLNQAKPAFLSGVLSAAPRCSFPLKLEPDATEADQRFKEPGCCIGGRVDKEKRGGFSSLAPAVG